MRKIKLTLKCLVPSWNYCNYDGFTADDRISKDLCRFCTKTKTGHHCMLFDEQLVADHKFVYKPPQCIDATAGFAITADEPQPTQGPTVDPRQIVRETIDIYKKTVNDLLKQGYPRQLAENVAKQYILDDK